MDDSKPERAGPCLFRIVGQIVRGCFIGGLFVLALIELYIQAGNIQAFRYVGF